MDTSRVKHILTIAIVLLTIATAVAQRGKSPALAALPPILMTCIHHPDVLESKPGTCPYCKLPLVPVRLDSAWMCPVHTTVTESNSGKCRMCGRQLVPVTVSLTWTCAADRATQHLEPGVCADGSPRIGTRTLRAHGNHNPQHGGQFFMAPDNWHHVEGAYLSTGVFRLYLYDDFTKPLPLNQVRDVTARLVTKQTFDTATKTTKELAAAPLVRNGRFLEARIGKLALPAQMTAKISFKKGGPEHVFDFAFEGFSKEPPAGPRTTQASPMTAPVATASAAAAAASEPRRSSPASTSSEGGGTIEIAPAMENALIPVPIPDTVPEIMAQLRTRTDQIRTFIDRGSFASIYVPAFQAKDLALALDARKDSIPADKRKIAQPAIAQLVRSAYLLDAFGDLGNKQQIVDAFSVFAAAVKDILASFPER